MKNNLSIIRQTHDGPPPHHSRERRNSHSYSPSPSRGTTSRSSSRPSSSSHQRSHSSGPTTYTRHVAPSPGRPIVTIQTNGGPPQVIRGSSGQYGATTYVMKSPIVYDPFLPPSPRPISSPALGSRPPAVHRSTVPYSPSPLRSPRSPGATSPVSSRPGVPSRRSTAPVNRSGGGGSNGGVMYNGKLIVGDPDEVQRYISSQKSIEKWIQNIG